MIYLFVFFISLVLTIFFTPMLIDFFTRIKIVDLPGEPRKIHTSIVPRMGGLIIFTIAMISTLSFYGDLNSIRFFVIASGIIVLLGITDDIFGVKWNHKFIIQFFMSLFLVYFLSQNFDRINLFGFEPAYPWNYILLIIFVVGVINSINLLDGLDGLVSGFSLMVIFVTFLVGLNIENKFLLVLSSSLMGALIGFLKFNAYPAKIFLGDTGAYTLGFFIITATIIASTNQQTSTLDMTFPVMLLGVPILDTIKVMFVRLLNKRNPFIADRSHIHHIILDRVANHKHVVFIIESIALLFAVVSLFYMRGDKNTAYIFFFILSVPVIFIDQFVKWIKWPVYPESFRKAYNNFPQMFINVYINFIIPVIAIAAAALLIGLVPIKTGADGLTISLSILFVLLLLIYSLVSYRKNRHFYDILVFFNLMLFFIYSNYSDQISNLFDIAVLFEVNSRNLLIVMLLPSVIFFLFFRDKILKTRIALFSGLDLLILVFIMLLSISSNLLPTKQFENANLVLFHSFLIYIFYKVFISIRSRYQPALFYLSFLMPIAALINLLITL